MFLNHNEGKTLKHNPKNLCVPINVIVNFCELWQVFDFELVNSRKNVFSFFKTRKFQHISSNKKNLYHWKAFLLSFQNSEMENFVLAKREWNGSLSGILNNFFHPFLQQKNYQISDWFKKLSFTSACLGGKQIIKFFALMFHEI